MGQLIVIDEDEYNKISVKASQADVYRQMIDEIQKELYPDWYCVDATNCFTADLMLLIDIRDEIRAKRKKYGKRRYRK